MLRGMCKMSRMCRDRKIPFITEDSTIECDGKHQDFVATAKESTRYINPLIERKYNTLHTFRYHSLLICNTVSVSSLEYW